MESEDRCSTGSTARGSGEAGVDQLDHEDKTRTRCQDSAAAMSGTLSSAQGFPSSVVKGVWQESCYITVEAGATESPQWRAKQLLRTDARRGEVRNKALARSLMDPAMSPTRRTKFGLSVPRVYSDRATGLGNLSDRG